MSLRIACDLDGTLADMDRALQREAQALFGPDVDLRAEPRRLESAEDVERELDAAAAADGDVERAKSGVRPPTGSELRRLWQHVAQVENFWASLDEKFST